MAEAQSPVDPFFEPWDGNGAEMADDLEEKHVTVNQWRHRKSIPPRVWPKLIAKAAPKGFTFTMDQLAAAFLPAAEVIACGACELRADDPACASCIRTDCGLRPKVAA